MHAKRKKHLRQKLRTNKLFLPQIQMRWCRHFNSCPHLTARYIICTKWMDFLMRKFQSCSTSAKAPRAIIFQKANLTCGKIWQGYFRNNYGSKSENENIAQQFSA